ncbi:MSCRAMM family protein [Glycomyces tritici]|uniref:alpha-amylase n=1 Tax=Glycomyces tritici TaxID=2665176 RepID=A0ABT7YK59_9ACTN|nr:carboxypeptidase regulatory-like domain-containing protein [Glycomyces tritici]MDN3239020.1 carboxypeptidase regulatory-like domain-containing protein [Glycomyces tritici]MDN3240182.1 carboxypeptidase regulatory-like domain-containing protein [Glycomyces tritici]
MLLALVSSGLVFERPARAQASGAWGEWGPFAGESGDFHADMTFATSPAITAGMESNSRGGGVGVMSGESNWLSAGTDIGAKYGTSKHQPYVNLRPQADRPDSPSYTTYAFNEPVPPGGWAFALGDIDADQVKVIAKGPDGSALTAAELGFQGAFNYCSASSPGGPSCTRDGTDVPTWDAATETLTGNAAAVDTDGASGWFEPTAPVASLTFVFTRRAGFPVYQTWFASLGCDITGSVTDSGAPAAGVTVNAVDRAGNVVAATSTGDDGSYSFPDYMVGGTYTVEVIAPPGKITDGPGRQEVDLGSCPAAPADFRLRDIVPTSVSGNVSTTDGEHLGGVTVTVALEDGTTRTTVTDSKGDYLFDEVAAGDHSITIDKPEQYEYEGAGRRDITVSPGQTTPITGQDFVLSALPKLAGEAVACGGPVPGVTVTLTRPGGSTESTVTDAAGAYAFAGLAAGDYTVEVDVPEGHSAAGATTRNVELAGTDVDGIDFTYAKPAAVVGTVTGPGGEPLAGVGLVVTPEGEAPKQAATGDDGMYSVGDLKAGSHTVAITAPAGYEVDGEEEQTVANTGTCGDAVADFALVASEPDGPTTGPGPGPGGPGTGDAGSGPGDGPGESPAGDAPMGAAHDDDLPLTGESLYIVVVAAAVFLLGAGAVMIAAVRARSREDAEPLA